jgi:hypothetical protein
MAVYYEAMRGVVHHHGGTVEKFAGVLREAYGEAGEDLVDPELVVALAEALAAAHDPFYGSGR